MNTDDDLPTSTLPEQLPMRIGGIEDPEKAKAFAHHVYGTLHEIGRHIDISRLVGFTATDEYPAVLADIDRGFETTNALTASDNSEMLGVAMCVHVMSDGVPKAHLAMHVEQALGLYMHEVGTDEHDVALQMLAHECAHIEDLMRKDDAYPGIILQQPVRGWFETELAPIGQGLWEEYYASRRSAIYRPNTTADMAGVLNACLDNNQAVVDAGIRSYRTHHDIPRLVSDTLDPATRALKAAAYLFGQVDGVDQDWDAIPETKGRIDNHHLGPLIYDMLTELQRLWDIRDEWRSPADMDLLTEIVHDAYAEAGVIAHPQGDGAYLTVPFTPQTM